jgi:hypothetical protein
MIQIISGTRGRQDAVFAVYLAWSSKDLISYLSSKALSICVLCSQKCRIF